MVKRPTEERELLIKAYKQRKQYKTKIISKQEVAKVLFVLRTKQKKKMQLKRENADNDIKFIKV